MSTQEQMERIAKAFAEAKAAYARAEAAMFEAYNSLVNEEPSEPATESDNKRQSFRRNAVAIERKKRCLTQKRLGIALGFKRDDAQPRVSQIESGDRAISDSLFKACAKVFGETPESLEAIGREHASQRERKILEVLRFARGNPVSIAALSDRLGLSTSEGWAEVEPLVNDHRVLKVPGGFVIATEELA